MKNYRVPIVTAFFLAVCVVIVFRTVRPVVEDPALRAARIALDVDKIALQREHLRRTADVWFYGAAGVLGAAGLAALIVASGIHRAAVKRAAVHAYQIAGSTIVIHERDLHLAAPIALGLVNAEQLRQMNGGLEKAFELSCRMADVQSRQLKALSAAYPSAKTVSEQLPPVGVEKPLPVPTFAELLNRGELAPGQPMILGYIQGVPRRGSFLDIYSAAIAGESGSGKTATLLYLIASGLIAEGIRFLLIDPHYPHPKSLGFKAKPLADCGAVTLATSLDDGRAVCRQIGDLIDQRLTQHDTTTTPVVLVVDELAFLNSTTLGPDLAQTMRRIATEGRKCAVYLLASSQTWLVESTGGSSVVRDTLTSAYIHRIKPKQANLILQDRDEVQKLKRGVKHAGQVLLCAVQHDSAIAQIPLITDADLQRVAAMVTTVNTPVTPTVPGPLAPLPDDAARDVAQHIQAYLHGNDLSLSKFAEAAGLNKGLLSAFLRGEKRLSPRLLAQVTAYLQHSNAHETR